jgi:hypothetical protein
LDSAIQYIGLLVANKRDAYAQVALQTAVPPKRGTKDFVAGTATLWCDYDSYKSNETIEQSRLELERYDPPPTLMINSGGGIHAYWRLERFVEQQADIENRNFGIASKLKQDACHSFEHILRIPGTYNFKDPAGFRKVTIISQNDHVYSLNDFAAVTVEAVYSGSILEEEEFNKVEIAQLGVELYGRILHGSKSDDRSTNDWFVACALLERGYTPGQVLSVFLTDEYYVGAKARQTNGIRYATRTIEKAARQTKKKFKARPAAPLQELINPLITTDKDGTQKIDLPVQPYEFIKEACRILENKGYKFVYDDADNAPYILTPTGELILARDSNRLYAAWISHVTLFTGESRAHRMFLTGISAYVSESGERARVHPWSWVEMDKGNLWLLGDHEQFRSVYRLGAGSDNVLKVPNGTCNYLFFPSENTFNNNIELPTSLMDVDVHNISELFDLTYEYFAVPAPIKAFLAVYMLAVPIAHCYVKNGMLPLLHLTGRAGHGKTEILKILGAFAHGTSEPESGTTIASARSIASKDILMPFDDYESLSKDLKEFILTSATGAKRHKMAADRSTVITQRNHILIALSSVADLPTDTLRRRAFRVEVSHPRWPTANYNSMYRDKLLRNRNKFWSMYCKFLVHDILPEFTSAVYYDLVDKVAAQILVPEFKPMAEFVALCIFIAQKLAKYDTRFDLQDGKLLMAWLAYFGVCDDSILASYDEFPPLLTGVADRYLADLRSGAIGNTLTPQGSPFGGRIAMTPTWMRGVYVEIPDPEILGPVPFELGSTLVLTGKLVNWVATLASSGAREFMAAWANPVKQLENKLKQLADLPGMVGDSCTADFVERGRHSGVYRIGIQNIWVQFILPSGAVSNSDLVIRLFFASGAYKAPGTKAKKRVPESELRLLASRVQAKLERGEISADEARAFLDTVNKLT